MNAQMSPLHSFCPTLQLCRLCLLHSAFIHSQSHRSPLRFEYSPIDDSRFAAMVTSWRPVTFGNTKAREGSDPKADRSRHPQLPVELVTHIIHCALSDDFQEAMAGNKTAEESYKRTVGRFIVAIPRGTGDYFTTILARILIEHVVIAKALRGALPGMFGRGCLGSLVSPSVGFRSSCDVCSNDQRPEAEFVYFLEVVDYSLRVLLDANTTW